MRLNERPQISLIIIYGIFTHPRERETRLVGRTQRAKSRSRYFTFNCYNQLSKLSRWMTAASLCNRRLESLSFILPTALIAKLSLTCMSTPSTAHSVEGERIDE